MGSQTSSTTNRRPTACRRRPRTLAGSILIVADNAEQGLKRVVVDGQQRLILSHTDGDCSSYSASNRWTKPFRDGGEGNGSKTSKIWTNKEGRRTTKKIRKILGEHERITKNGISKEISHLEEIRSNCKRRLIKDRFATLSTTPKPEDLLIKPTDYNDDNKNYSNLLISQWKSAPGEPTQELKDSQLFKVYEKLVLSIEKYSASASDRKSDFLYRLFKKVESMLWIRIEEDNEQRAEILFETQNNRVCYSCCRCCEVAVIFWNSLVG